MKVTVKRKFCFLEINFLGKILFDQKEFVLEKKMTESQLRYFGFSFARNVVFFYKNSFKVKNKNH